MALFRRKREDSGELDDLLSDGESSESSTEEHDDAVDGVEDSEAEDAFVEPPPAPLSVRSEGPWDSSELSEEELSARLDLGGLKLLVPEGVEVRVDLDQNQAVQAATLVHGEEIMQLGCFAAPRTEGIWDEVRDEIRDSILSGGGQATESEGPFGTVLTARIPTDQPGMFAPARFIGVSGPRWFLRALTSGPLAAQGEDDPLLLTALRGVAVVRGPDAMAPRDPLPLRLPKEAQESAEAAIAAQNEIAEGGNEQRPGLELPERGPEITETR